MLRSDIGGDDIFDTTTLTFAITYGFQFFTLSDKLVVPNSRERVGLKAANFGFAAQSSLTTCLV